MLLHEKSIIIAVNGVNTEKNSIWNNGKVEVFAKKIFSQSADYFHFYNPTTLGDLKSLEERASEVASTLNLDYTFFEHNGTVNHPETRVPFCSVKKNQFKIDGKYYDRVYILAHSHGVQVADEILKDLNNKGFPMKNIIVRALGGSCYISKETSGDAKIYQYMRRYDPVTYKMFKASMRQQKGSNDSVIFIEDNAYFKPNLEYHYMTHYMKYIEDLVKNNKS